MFFKLGVDRKVAPTGTRPRNPLVTQVWQQLKVNRNKLVELDGIISSEWGIIQLCTRASAS